MNLAQNFTHVVYLGFNCKINVKSRTLHVHALNLHLNIDTMYCTCCKTICTRLRVFTRYFQVFRPLNERCGLFLAFLAKFCLKFAVQRIFRPSDYLNIKNRKIRVFHVFFMYLASLCGYRCVCTCSVHCMWRHATSRHVRGVQSSTRWPGGVAQRIRLVYGVRALCGRDFCACRKFRSCLWCCYGDLWCFTIFQRFLRCFRRPEANSRIYDSLDYMTSSYRKSAGSTQCFKSYEVRLVFQWDFQCLESWL